jgi:outer membrane receptor for ferrienterochelin and colicin
MQYELTYKTSIQAEVRFRDLKYGDVSLNFFEDNDFPDLNQEDQTDTYRLGFRHAFSPGSNLIGNFSYQDKEGKFFNVTPQDPAETFFPPPPVESHVDEKDSTDAYSAELQHLFRSDYINTVTGGGYFRVEQKFQFTEDWFWPITSPPIYLGPVPRSDVKFDTDHYNVYLYAYLNPLESLTVTLGASGDFYDREDKVGNEDLDKDKFNPKFGITWNPIPSTTLRGAVFRTFKRTLITNQTLEPTQVAGFNQFYDDFDATRAWVYGAAVDQKFPKNIYGGAEFSYRDLKVPIYQVTSGGTTELNQYNWDEYLGRAYLNWTPHEWLALSAEYRYEKFKYQEDFNRGAERVTTHSVPLGANFFHPSGLSCGLKVTYWDQDGKFKHFDSFSVKNADDTFWLVDAAIRYRFPKRYGFFTVGVTNLFDEDFEYFEVDTTNSRIQPSTFYFASITLAVP